MAQGQNFIILRATGRVQPEWNCGQCAFIVQNRIPLHCREECVSAWVPKGQWNLIMQSVAASGELPTTDVKTAEMEVQVETGVLVSCTLSFLGMSNCFFFCKKRISRFETGSNERRR